MAWPWILATLVLTVALASGPVTAGTVSAPDEGCARTTVTTDTPPPTPLINIFFPVVVQPIVLTHPCDGPLFLRGGLQVELAPTVAAPASASALVQIRCLSGGCPVTGTVILAAPGSASVALRDAGLPPMSFNLPLSAIFPDLPAGNYLVEIVSFGANATVAARQVWVLDAGYESRADRSIPAP